MSEREPDWDDVESMIADEEDNAPPTEPFYAFEEDEDIYDDEDDLCPDCLEPFDCCVCGDDDDSDWPSTDGFEVVE